MQITLPTWKATIEYRELFRVIEWRGSCVYKTERIGYVSRDYVPKPGEFLESLSFTMMSEPTVTLDVITPEA